MRLAASTAVVIFATVLVFAANDGPPPPWAYGFPSAAAAAPATAPAAPAPAAAAPAPDVTPRQIPGSSGSFTLAQIRDGFGPADWFPGDHPAMPEIVAHGKRPDVRACSLCHYPNGKGRPENAGVSGLPVAYFIQTMADFKAEARKSADSRKGNTNLMIAYAKAMTDDEVKAAAEYFAAMKWTPWIKVVEAATVPKTRIAGGMFLKLDGGDDRADRRSHHRGAGRHASAPSRCAIRAPASRRTCRSAASRRAKRWSRPAAARRRAARCATAPTSRASARSPASPAARRATPCASCSTRSSGTRKGVWADLMKPVVANLTNDDMLAIAAYTASRHVTA